MSFFSRKPNPPVPPAASQAIGAILASPSATPATKKAAINALNKIANVSPTAAQSVGANQNAEQQAPSNTRFRSFAERYIVERCRDWKDGEIDERAWAAILEAKSIYNKVKEVGRTLTNDN